MRKPGKSQDGGNSGIIHERLKLGSWIKFYNQGGKDFLRIKYWGRQRSSKEFIGA